MSVEVRSESSRLARVGSGLEVVDRDLNVRIPILAEQHQIPGEVHGDAAGCLDSERVVGVVFRGVTVVMKNGMPPAT